MKTKQKKPAAWRHSPGPWVVDKTMATATVRSANLRPVARCYQGDMDASLIAAAPELLAALLALLEDHHRMFPEAHPNSTIKWSGCEEVKAACAAIAKAEVKIN